MAAGTGGQPLEGGGLDLAGLAGRAGHHRAGFMAVLERQDRQLELLLERTAPASQAP